MWVLKQEQANTAFTGKHDDDDDDGAGMVASLNASMFANNYLETTMRIKCPNYVGVMFWSRAISCSFPINN